MCDQGQLGLLGGFGEGAVAVVPKEEIAAANAGNVEIGKALVQGGAEGGAHTDTIADGDMRPHRDIGKRAIAEIAVEGIAAKLITEVDVLEAVAVKIRNGQAAAVIVEVDLELISLLARQI